MTNTYGYLLPRKITIIIFPEHDIYIFKSDKHREHENHENMEKLKKRAQAFNNIPNAKTLVG